MTAVTAAFAESRQARAATPERFHGSARFRAEHQQLLFLAVPSIDLQQQSQQPMGQILGRLIAPQQLFSNFLPNGLVPAAQVPDPDQRCLPGTIRVLR